VFENHSSLAPARFRHIWIVVSEAEARSSNGPNRGIRAVVGLARGFGGRMGIEIALGK